MSKQPVLNILKDIFQACEYDVDSSYISDIVASKGTSDRVYVKLDREVDYNSLRRFADSMKNTEGRGLYILLNVATTELSEFANQQGLILWDQSVLEQQIGKAILANASGEQMELTLEIPIAETPFNIFEPPTAHVEQEGGIFGLFSEPSTPQKEHEPEPEPEPEPESAFKWPEFDSPSKDVEWGRDMNLNVNQNRAVDTQEPSGPGYQEPEDVLISIPLPSFPINMAKTSAIKIGQAKVGEVQDFLLKFIPYYSYRYDFETKRKLASEIVDLDGQGEGMVNAITGDNKFTRIPGILEYADIPTGNYHIKEPVVTDNKAQETALNAIIEKHTTKISKDEVKGDTIVYENKIISPGKSEINLPIQLIYVPVWEIHGKNNTVDINAYDGHVVEEPLDDDAEFV
ncbi:MAG: hypothetical protein KAR76_04030 [Methanosarcinales archaeon]|nr:hypothetical protein [Methanosarcinales archaeon]